MNEIIEKDIEIHGNNFYYLESGKGDPLVLLHGATTTAKTDWINHIPILMNHFQVFAPDLRGHGGSSNHPEGSLKPQALAQDIVAFFQALDIESPLICGWSLGGQIALEIGIQFPDIPKALIAGGVMFEPTEGFNYTLFELFGINGPRDIDFEKLSENLPVYVSSLEKNHSNWKELLNQLSVAWCDKGIFPRSNIKRIENPVLLILGDRDHTTSVEHAVQMYRMIPNSQLAIFPQATHSLPSEFVEMFCDVILNFWNQISQ
ncbi:MAG: alpha/beta fold hydrolase [Promethearchaeota archaeon]